MVADDRDQIKRLQQALAIAEAQTPIANPAGNGAFDREPDRCAVKISSKHIVEKCKVAIALQEWLESTGSANPDWTTLEGPQSGKRFTLRFTGAIGLASSRCSAAIQGLRKGPRSWYQFSCATPSGDEVLFFVAQDKNSRQIKTEVQTKMVVKILGDLYLGRDFFANRQLGIVSSEWVEIVKVVPYPESEPTQLLWSAPAVRRFDLDTGGIIRIFRSSFSERPEVVWSEFP